MLPKAAELYCRQIALGLDGDSRAALKARVALRQLLVGGTVDVQREPDGSAGRSVKHSLENWYARLEGMVVAGACY